MNSGEFVTGRDAITSEMNEGVKREHQVNSGSVWRWLKQFEKRNVEHQINYEIQRYINKNWSLYQSSEQQMNIKRTTSEQQVHTNKNEKNYKNEKNNKTSSSQPRKSVFTTPTQFTTFSRRSYSNRFVRIRKSKAESAKLGR